MTSGSELHYTIPTCWKPLEQSAQMEQQAATGCQASSQQAKEHGSPLLSQQKCRHRLAISTHVRHSSYIHVLFQLYANVTVQCNICQSTLSLR